jgi:hypothetical protein
LMGVYILFPYLKKKLKKNLKYILSYHVNFEKYL